MGDTKPLPAPVAPRIPLAREDVELSFKPPWNVKHDTLRGWQTLPRELKDHIWSLACTLRPLRSWSKVDISPQAIHKGTALNVALVSRSCYKLAVKLLYGRADIKHPSALQELQRTLASRPNLGLLIKSLHVGPSTDLHQYWWPLRSWVGSSSVRLSAVLGGHESDRRRPQWCSPRQEFELPFRAHNGCCREGYRATIDAIEAAARALDVDLKRANKDCAGNDVGASIWIIRLFEVQAACELFLLEARRREDAHPRDQPGPYRYPRLAVTGYSPEAPDDDVLWITRGQLRSRNARRGAWTDHFSHPLIFSRSGLQWAATDLDGEVHEGGDNADLVEEASEDAVDLFALSSTPRQRSARDGYIDVRDDLHFPLPPTATVGGNLALLRAVLAFTPRLKFLSLTGFFERAVVGTRSAPALQALESLTIGPPPSGWHLPVRLDHSAFAGLKRLRICGVELDQSDVDCILGLRGALPQLEDFQWSLASRFVGTQPSTTLTQTMTKLLDFDDPASKAAGTKGSSKKRLRKSTSGGDGRACPIFVQAYLHGADARSVLAAAPSPELRSAWRNGRPMMGYNRFQVFVTRAHGIRGSEAQKEKKALGEMYDEGKEWWDEGALVKDLIDGASEGGEGDSEGEDAMEEW